MQHTRLADSSTTHGAGDGGYLRRSEFTLFHAAQDAVATAGLVKEFTASASLFVMSKTV